MSLTAEEIEQLQKDSDENNLSGVFNHICLEENDYIIIHAPPCKLKLDKNNPDFSIGCFSINTARKLKIAVDSMVELFEEHEKHGIKLNVMTDERWAEE